VPDGGGPGQARASCNLRLRDGDTRRKDRLERGASGNEPRTVGFSTIRGSLRLSSFESPLVMTSLTRPLIRRGVRGGELNDAAQGMAAGGVETCLAEGGSGASTDLLAIALEATAQ
jgi:hypothetical protein